MQPTTSRESPSSPSSLNITRYSLLVLHHSFFILLFEAGLIEFESYRGVVWTVLLFPLFFLLCVGVQRLLSPAAGRRAP